MIMLSRSLYNQALRMWLSLEIPALTKDPLTSRDFYIEKDKRTMFKTKLMFKSSVIKA